MFCLLLNTVSGYSHVCCFPVLLQTFKLTTPIALWCRLYLFNSAMSIWFLKIGEYRICSVLFPTCTNLTAQICCFLALLQICKILLRTFDGAGRVCSDLKYVLGLQNYLCGIAYSVVFSNLRRLHGSLKSGISIWSSKISFRLLHVLSSSQICDVYLVFKKAPAYVPCSLLVSETSSDIFPLRSFLKIRNTKPTWQCRAISAVCFKISMQTDSFSVSFLSKIPQ